MFHITAVMDLETGHWYAEIYNVNGRLETVTRLAETKMTAEKLAQEWAEAHSDIGCAAGSCI